MIVENYEPKAKVENEVEKRVACILNKIRYSILIPILLLVCIKKINVIKWIVC